MNYPELGCSDYTATKQQVLAAILGFHLSITGAIMRRRRYFDPVYRYFDLNAGPGRYDYNGTEIAGSPLVFLSLARQAGMRYRALLFERCVQMAADLASNVRDYPGVEVFWGDHNQRLDEQISYHPRTLGLIYTDPNNHEVPFRALGRFCAAYPKVDVLIHVASNAIKRTRKPDDPDLLSRMLELKPHWLARVPASKWQWTFLLGSNWDGFDDYKKIGFYRIDTETGQAIVDRLNTTRKERQERDQLPLPLLSGVFATPVVSPGARCGHAPKRRAVRAMRPKTAK